MNADKFVIFAPEKKFKPITQEGKDTTGEVDVKNSCCSAAQ
jgi:hypothetical protein